MAFPVSARADRFSIERMLTILEARASARYPLIDTERFGLIRPDARLAVDNETFSYGAVNETTREQYVATGSAVYVVPVGYAATLPRNADTLLARELLSQHEVPVRFALRDFNIRSDAGAWRSDAKTEASADEIAAWVGAWRNASALTAIRHDGRAPLETIEIELAGGRLLEIGIVQREPELVLARLDEGVQYRFFGPQAKRLLLPPGSAVGARARTEGTASETKPQ
jgi:hypothetical protein